MQTNYFSFIIICFLCSNLFINFCWSAEESKVTENNFCVYESFQPSCSNSGLIKIESAKFGRMNIGKCLKESEQNSLKLYINDPNYFGCFKDVTNLIQANCSLQLSCIVKVFDLNQKIIGVCASGLNSYLEVNYSCLEIAHLSQDCKIQMNHKMKHIAPNSLLIAENRCGSEAKPITIEAQKGQIIKMKIIAMFNDNKEDKLISLNIGNLNTNIEKCTNKYGSILDIQSNKNYTICDEQFEIVQRMLSEITSKSNKMLVIFNEMNRRKLNKILFRVEAEGCTDIFPPEDSWLKRNNNDLVIGCYSSKRTWYLKCQNNDWIGVLGNCSTYDAKTYSIQIITSDENNIINIPKNHQILIIVSITAFGIVICLIIIFTGAICLKRSNCNSENHKSVYQTYYNNPSNNQIMNENFNQNLISTNIEQSQINKPTSILINDAINFTQDSNIIDNNYFILDENLKT